MPESSEEFFKRVSGVDKRGCSYDRIPGLDGKCVYIKNPITQDDLNRIKA